MKKAVIDLTPNFLEAKELIGKGYIMDYLLTAIKDFAVVNNLRYDWDKGEEVWGMIYDKKSLMRFHESIPFIFVNEDLNLLFVNFVQKREVQIPIAFIVSNWQDEIYTMNFDLLKGILEWNSSISHEIFSIGNLWYATV